MKAAGSNERALIRRLFLRRRAHDEGVEVANGDDASVHTLPEGMALAVSCDAALAGSHWPRGFDLEQAAERAVQAAFSDLAAMGASARWCWSALMAADAAALTALGRGVRAGCGRIGAVLVGGDCVRSRVNGVSLTVAGLLPTGSAMRRDAA
ncbi:MAG: thiamine-phosphate kinase, partial [Zetaproteobacteria bacterium]